MTVYKKIEFVFSQFPKPLSPADFRYLDMQPLSASHDNALEYVGCSEASLGRRIREMANTDRLRSWYRTTANGKRYKVFENALTKVPA